MKTPWQHLRSPILSALAMIAVTVMPTLASAQIDEARELGQFLGQHGYGAIKVNLNGQNRQILEASINGKVTNFVIDTGCSRTCITNSWARSLGLSIHETARTNWGMGGQIRAKIGTAVVTSFKLNNYELNRTNTVDILPASAETRSILDGLFGVDLLHDNAAILPVGARFFMYKPGKGPAVSIAPYLTALGYQPVSLSYDRGLRINGQIEGQPFTALIDCGAEITAFDLAYVKKLKSANIAFENMNLLGIDGRESRASVFTPRQMQLGSTTIGPFPMTVTETPMFAHEGFNALLGYDFLAAHNAIIDLGNNQLWLKER